MKNLQFIDFSETEVLQVAISNDVANATGKSLSLELIAADNDRLPMNGYGSGRKLMRDGNDYLQLQNVGIPSQLQMIASDGGSDGT